MPPKDWPYPSDHTIVGGAEEFVKAARQKMADDIANLTRAVVGKQGRAFMQVPLSPAERDERFQMLRESDDPQGWLDLLASTKGDPHAQAGLTRWLRDSEAQYRAAQAQPPQGPTNGSGPDTTAA